MATEAITALGFTVAVENGLPPTQDQAGYEDVSMTYDEVTGVTSLDGDMGYSFNSQTTADLKTGVQKTAKGIKVYSPITLILLDNVTSVGRTTLEAAAASQRGEVSLKLTDADTNVIYLSGVVTSDTKTVGNADNIMNNSFMFTPNYDPVYV